MPTYDYKCQSCGYRFEKFQPIKARVLRKCPKCAKMSLRRLIGSGSGLLFRGSGFYQTDYRSPEYKHASRNAENTANIKQTDKNTKTQTAPDTRKTPPGESKHSR